MTSEAKKDLPASVRARLLNLAKTRGEDLDLVLKRYGIERLLFRLSQSPHGDLFILKGAMLFELWMGRSHRTTRDLDLLGSGSPDISRLEGIFRSLCEWPVEPDGLEFLPETVKGAEIRESNHYQGIRITILARLGAARIALQIDIGFGDAVVPPPETVTYPSILGFSAPTLRAYPKAAVVAEKFHAIVLFGLANSRLKDYHDIWMILRSFEVASDTLEEAIKATFKRRRTEVPRETPDGLTQEFASDPLKRSQWRAFLRKKGLDPTLELAQVVHELSMALGKVLHWGLPG